MAFLFSGGAKVRRLWLRDSQRSILCGDGCGSGGNGDYDVVAGVAFSTDRHRDNGALVPLWSSGDAGRIAANGCASWLAPNFSYHLDDG